MNNVNSNTVPPRPSREQIAAVKRSSTSCQYYDYMADLKVNDIRRLAQKHDIEMVVAQRVLKQMDQQFC